MAALLAMGLFLFAAPASAYTYKLIADKSCEGVRLTSFQLLPIPTTCKSVHLVKPSSIAILHEGWEEVKRSRGDCMVGGYSFLGSVDPIYVALRDWREKNAGKTQGDKDTTYLATCVGNKSGVALKLEIRSFPGNLTLEQIRAKGGGSRKAGRRSGS